MTRIPTGQVDVELVCPSCGELAVIPATLASRLVMVRDEPATLGLRVKAAKVPHSCGQLTMTAALELVSDSKKHSDTAPR